MRWCVLLSALLCSAASWGQHSLLLLDRDLPRLTGGQTHLVTSRDAAATASGATQVLLDVDGPGLVSRLWFAKPEGTLRAFVDGEREPRLDHPLATLPTADLWPRLPGLCQAHGGVLRCDLAIGFARHLRLEVSNARPLRYELTWTTVPTGQPLPEFPKTALAPPLGTPERSRLMRSTLDELIKKQSADAVVPGVPESKSALVTVPAGGSKVIHEASTPGCLQRLALAPEPDTLGVLRGLRLRATWDGAARPSVDLPLADLLGLPFGRRGEAAGPYSRLAGYIVAWPMPYARSAKVELVNTSGQPVQVKVDIVVARRDEGSGYFCATGAVAEPAAGQPVTLLDATARGKYLSTSIAIEGDAPAALRGTVRFAADGGAPQSCLDTGAYFGVADRVGRELASGPFESIVPVWPDGSQLDAQRSHRLAPVSFERSLRVTLDHGESNEVVGCRYRTVALWYAAEPATPPAMPAAEPTAPRTLALGRAQIIEAESLTIALPPGSKAKTKVVDDSELTYTASGGKALAFWTPEGESITLSVPVPHDGLYQVGWRAADGGVWGVRTVSRMTPGPTPGGTAEGEMVRASSGQGIDIKLGRVSTFRLPDGIKLPFIEVPRGSIDCFWLREIASVKDAVEAEQTGSGLTCTWDGPPFGRAERSPMVQGADLPDVAIDSGGAYSRLSGGLASDEMSFTLRVPKIGRYGLALGLRQGPGAGAVKVLVDKQVVGTIDCGASERLVGARFGLGSFSFAPLRKPVKGPSHRPAGAPGPPAGGYHTVRLVATDGRPVEIDYLLMRPDAAGQEAEFLMPDAGTASSLVVWERSGQEPAWSGGSYARVEGAAPGHSARFTVDVPRAGRYRVRLMSARLPGGVPTRAWLGGRLIGTLACTGQQPGLGRAIARTVWLPAGRQTLALEATKPGTIALDYVQLDRRRPARLWWLVLGFGAAVWLRRRRLQVAPQVPTGD